MDDFMTFIGRVNEFIFIVGGYVMLIGWWADLSILISIGAVVMSGCFVFGLVGLTVVFLYPLITGILNK
jgi:hypothetical protein